MPLLDPDDRAISGQDQRKRAPDPVPKRLTHVFSPLALGPVEVRNRVFISAHHTNFARGGRVSSRLVDYHRERARAGVGLIVTEPFSVHPTSRHNVDVISLWQDADIAGLRELTDAIHAEGAKAFCQLLHCGRQQDAVNAARGPVGPSALPDPAHACVPHALAVEEIEKLVDAHADAADRAVQAGYDGVEIHCAHGYLLQQFLSPWSNRRTDRYGGSWEGRLAFPSAVVAAVRRRVGPRVAVGVRATVGETVAGGLNEAEAARSVEALAALGLDYVSLSAGQHVSSELVVPPAGTPPAPLAKSSGALKRRLGLPVLTSHRIRSLDVAERLIADGKADMVNMARAHIADPLVVAKWRAGQASRVRPCIGCLQGCVGRLNQRLPIGCFVNPALTRGLAEATSRSGRGRRVAVVGGGPAGLQAAVTLAERGDKPTLFEATSALGGRLRAAATMPGRVELLEFVDWQAAELRRAGVSIWLNTSFSEADAASGDFEAIVVATGARSPPPTVEFPCDQPILSGDEAVVLEPRRDGTVLVVDRGDFYNQAILIATRLAEKGTRAVVAALGRPVGARLEGANARVLGQRAARSGVRTLSFCTVVEIAGERATLAHEGWPLVVDDISTVVVVDAPRPDTLLLDRLTAMRLGVLLRGVGDCHAPRGGLEAVEDAYATALTL